jgi:glycosyltransferase involved in cell wall biosynthesis
VIAFDCGSVPEVVDEGVTGCVVRSIDEAVAAVCRALLLDRRRIRQMFEQRFSADAMATRYIELYWRLVQGADAQLRRSA